MSKFYLAKFSMDYADEFYANGMNVYTEEEYTDIQRAVKDFQKNQNFMEEEVYVGFGSNEELTGCVDEFIDNICFKEITEEEYNVLKKHANNFGLVTPDEVIQNINSMFVDYNE